MTHIQTDVRGDVSTVKSAEVSPSQEARPLPPSLCLGPLAIPPETPWLLYRSHAAINTNSWLRGLFQDFSLRPQPVRADSTPIMSVLWESLLRRPRKSAKLEGSETAGLGITIRQLSLQVHLVCWSFNVNNNGSWCWTMETNGCYCSS